ncbi:HpcH/HpaI aldolase/citrate lyase family protein [Sphingobium sp. C100]|uniref:HpcH/HpaI aldolase/citrate lyase family protein n=1 Tax=Sphingobium sp. C100 TaxID=1207055 RepID=UPI0003FE8B8C|nr:CoA ester lyase [Sphingobium sp. C100]
MAQRCDPQMAVAPLFIPANRPGLFEKASKSGTEAIIIDLEDAVAPSAKEEARRRLVEVALPSVTRIVRVNAIGTPWHADDVAALSGLDIDAVMLPKCESAEDVAFLAGKLGRAVQIIALIETAVGIVNAAAVAASPDVSRLAFGSIDFCADIGCATGWDSLLHARSAIVLASRLGSVAAPIDGVTLGLHDTVRAQQDARRAAQLGFSGKMCIHPSQVAAVQAGFAPRDEEVAWARRVVGSKDSGVASIDGMMVDPPVIRRAEQILAQARSIAAR